MKRLIIPDIHNKIWTVKKILSNEKADEVCFLGDWFDSPNDTPQDASKTAKYVKNLMKNPKHKFIWGNHDISYAYSKFNLSARCSGYTVAKDIEITKVLSKDEWSNFKFFRVVDGWLLTHAGLHNEFSKSTNGDLDSISSFLEEEQLQAYRALKNSGAHSHWMFTAGRARGGRQIYGGLTWCDANEEFSPIHAIKQIFGHTPRRSLAGLYNREDMNVGKDNLCIDTGLNHYAILEDGKMTVKQIKVSNNSEKLFLN